jgi:bifunctional enzyme CysN/CysC
MICVMALVSPNDETRQRAAKAIGSENFILVHLDAPADLCSERNLSGNKEGATEEKMSSYQPPENADLVLNTAELSPAECVEKVIELLESKKVI